MERRLQLQAGAAAGVGISLTAGFVSWALRAGSMAASFLAAMPTWRHFDPMPVFTEDEESRATVVDKDDNAAGDTLAQAGMDEDAVEELFDR